MPLNEPKSEKKLFTWKKKLTTTILVATTTFSGCRLYSTEDDGLPPAKGKKI